MNLQAVFAYMQEKNITLAVDNGELVVRAAQGVIDSKVMALLKQHKHELLVALGQNQGQDQAAPVSEDDSQQALPIKIAPDMLPLVDLTQEQIDRIVLSVPQGVANIQDIYPLAPLQEGILFHHLLETQGDTYLLRSVVAFEKRKGLDAFLAALQTVINRHDILRSAVYWQYLPQPVQVVHRQAPLCIEELALVGDDDALQQLLNHTDPRHLRLDLQQAPLLAAYIVADPHSDEWLLALLSHHIVCDHISLELIIAEIQMLLQGRGDKLPVSLAYRDFIAQARSVSPAEHEAYFRRQLGDINEPTAPFERLNVQSSGEPVIEASLTLSDDLAQRIRDNARQQGVTAAVLFHAAWAQVLAQCTG
ncbi:MAG: condensation domain-containing protein, partial [Methylobacter sp.]|nr:condensation domain-containing protein [Methylobacter sp.]